MLEAQPVIVGGSQRRVKVALLVGVHLTILGGCFWRSYGKAAATHAELLVAMARKGADLVANGRLTAESMPELTYPLERADAFARTAATRGGDEAPASLRALEDLRTRYQAFLDVLDRVRREKSGQAARAALAEPLAGVERAGEAVRAALRAEGRL
jgi:hypothetical protein